MLLWHAVAATLLFARAGAQLQWSLEQTYTVCSTATVQLAPSSTPAPGSTDTEPPASAAPDTDPAAPGQQQAKRQDESWDIYVYNMGVPQMSSVDVDVDTASGVGTQLKMQSEGAPTQSVAVATDAQVEHTPTPSPELNGGRPAEATPQAGAGPSEVPRLDGGQGGPATTPAPGAGAGRRALAPRALINMTLIQGWGGGELQWQVNVPPGVYRLGAVSAADRAARIDSAVFSVRPGSGSACVPPSFLPARAAPGLDWRAVVGIVAGGVGGIVLVGLAIWLGVRRCKRRRAKPLDESFWHMYYPTRIASPGGSTPSAPYTSQVPDYSYYGTGTAHAGASFSSLPRPSGPRSIRSVRSLRSLKSKPAASEKMDVESQIHVTYNAYRGGIYTPLELQVRALTEGSKNDVALEQELRALFRHSQKDHYTDLEAAVMTLLDRPGEKPLAPEIRRLYEEVLSRRASSAYSGFTARESLETLRTQRAPPVRPARPPSAQLPEELSPQVQVPAQVRSPAGSTATLLGSMMLGRKRRSQQQEVMRAEVMRSPDGDEKRIYHHLNYNNY